MVELAIASSLIHPNVFGATWIGLVLLCSWKIGIVRLRAHGQSLPSDLSADPAIRIPSPVSRTFSSPVPAWLLAFGPLLAISINSVIVHRLSLSRAEMLEVTIGGTLLAAGLPLIRIRSKHIGLAAVFASLVALVVAVYDLTVLQLERAGAGFHPINYGIGCGIVLIMLTVWLKFRSAMFRDTPTPILVAGVGAALVALLASGSRGPILSFLICMGVASLSWSRHSRRTIWRSSIGLGLLGLVAAVIFYRRVSLELSSGELTSHGIRWQLIQLSLEQIQQTPLLGIGVDQAGKFFAQFPEPIHSLNHAHVTLLNAALELGVLGAAAWLWAFGVLAWFFWQEREKASPAFWQAGLLLTAFIFLCSMTQDIMSHTYTRRLLTLALVLFMVLCKENPKDSTWPSPPSAPS